MVLCNPQEQPDIFVQRRVLESREADSSAQSPTAGTWQHWRKLQLQAQCRPLCTKLPCFGDMPGGLLRESPHCQKLLAERTTKPPHVSSLPSGNEPRGLWKAFLDPLFQGSCLPQGKCVRRGSLSRAREDRKRIRAEVCCSQPWCGSWWDQDGNAIP